MTDVQDTTDDQWRLYKIRRLAASLLRGAGLRKFADEVERGELDDCPEMRLGAFFIDPPQPHGDEFIAAWNEAAAKVDALRQI